MAQVALAWTLTRQGVASTLIGARDVAQLQSNVAAADIRLDDDHRRRLDAASAPAASFSSGLTAPAIRRMVFGGRDVTGWGEQSDRVSIAAV